MIQYTNETPTNGASQKPDVSTVLVSDVFPPKSPMEPLADVVTE